MKIINYICLTLKYYIMEAISNKITDWLKVFSYVLVFLFVVCSFTNTDYFYGLTIISFVSCIFGYLLFALINKIIKT